MVRLKDLHALPKVRDSWSYLYVEHARIDKEQQAVAVHDADGMVPVPAASVTTLMLGPGTTISHAAVQALADNGCTILWCGEGGVRMYAQGMGETRAARHQLRQAQLWADPALRLGVVARMYRVRFPEELDPSLTLQQIRGKEGVRVRDAYARASRETGVPWTGRSYKREDWATADAVNRALSAASSCLYGICHASIVSAGYSPAMGFVHTGKMLSFVYDIADLYKVEIAVPAAFRAAANDEPHLERRVRQTMRDLFHEQHLLARIVPDIGRVLGIADDSPFEAEAFDMDEALPGGLWDPDRGEVAGGVNRADDTGTGEEQWSSSS